MPVTIWCRRKYTSVNLIIKPHENKDKGVLLFILAKKVNLIGFMFMCFQICGFIPSATVEWISEQEVPYATYGSAWVGYDNIQSYSAKVTTTICNSK